jgi:hypothetical protein
MKYINENQIQDLQNARWTVCYTTIEGNYKNIIEKINIPVFGCSSFQGVFIHPKVFLKELIF